MLHALCFTSSYMNFNVAQAALPKLREDGTFDDLRKRIEEQLKHDVCLYISLLRLPGCERFGITPLIVAGPCTKAGRGPGAEKQALAANRCQQKGPSRSRGGHQEGAGVSVALLGSKAVIHRRVNILRNRPTLQGADPGTALSGMLAAAV